MTAQELEQRLDLRAKLAAIIDELDRLDADVDVPRTIAEGCLEELDRLLAREALAGASGGRAGGRADTGPR